MYIRNEDPYSISMARFRYWFVFTSVVFLLISVIACSPVRQGNYTSDKSKQGKNLGQPDTLLGSTSSESMLGSGTNMNRGSGKDTIRLVLEPLIYQMKKADNNSSAEEKLRDISDLLDKGMVEQASYMADALYETLDEGSQQKQHAHFYRAEALIAKNQIPRAKEILADLLESDIKGVAKEKAVIRMGQILCLEGDITGAETYFNILRIEYPKSIYLPLAKCIRRS